MLVSNLGAKKERRERKGAPSTLACPPRVVSCAYITNKRLPRRLIERNEIEDGSENGHN